MHGGIDAWMFRQMIYSCVPKTQCIGEKLHACMSAWETHPWFGRSWYDDSILIHQVIIVFSHYYNIIVNTRILQTAHLHCYIQHAMCA